MLGWRRDVTKIVVLITDAPQHISGDGLVAGIWKPYKHECSLVDVSRQTLCFYDLKSLVSLLIHVNFLNHSDVRGTAPGPRTGGRGL